MEVMWFCIKVIDFESGSSECERQLTDMASPINSLLAL